MVFPEVASKCGRYGSAIRTTSVNSHFPAQSHTRQAVLVTLVFSSGLLLIRKTPVMSQELLLYSDGILANCSVQELARSKVKHNYCAGK